MLNTQLQSNNDFFEDLISHIRLAQTRIYLQAMIWFPEDMVYRLLLELEKAKEKNPQLDIQISYDKLSKKYLLSERKEGRMSYSKTMKEFFASFAPNIQTNILDTFGLGYHLSGRDHKKIYIVDNIFWLGGCNMHYAGMYDQLDFMVRFNGENTLTDTFVDIFQRSLDRKKFEKKDREFEFEHIPNFKFLIDSGKPGKSIIQQNFLNIVNSAQKEILISTQYYPTGNILSTIRKLGKQGIHTKWLMGDPRIIKECKDFPYQYIYKYVLRQLADIPNFDFYQHNDRKIHNKFVIVDNEIAMFGSHNFEPVGVMLGTSEDAVIVRDSDLIKELRKWFEKTREECKLVNQK